MKLNEIYIQKDATKPVYAAHITFGDLPEVGEDDVEKVTQIPIYINNEKVYELNGELFYCVEKTWESEGETAYDVEYYAVK